MYMYIDTLNIFCWFLNQGGYALYIEMKGVSNNKARVVWWLPQISRASGVVDSSAHSCPCEVLNKVI